MTTSAAHRRRLSSVAALGVTALSTALLSLGSPTASAAPTADTSSAASAATGWRASVGPGWVVDATSTSGSTQPGTRGPFTLALVSPTGVRHVVARTPYDIQITDVSPDGKRALALRQLPDYTSRVLEFDLVKGTSHVVSSQSALWARYSRPSASQVLVPEADLQHVDRLGLDGKLLARYATGGSDLASSGNGRYVVTTPYDTQGLPVMDAATGALVRYVPSPSGYDLCYPVGTWDATHITARCMKVGPTYLTSDMLTVSTTTGSTTLLTHATPGDPVEHQGYDGAWKVGKRVLAQRFVDCGPGPVGVVDAAGHIGTELSWPATWTAPQVVGVTGTSVVASSGSCFNDAPSTALAVQDAFTHRTVALDVAAHLSAAVVDHE